MFHVLPGCIEENDYIIQVTKEILQLEGKQYHIHHWLGRHRDVI